MLHTVIGFFDNVADAQRAVQELQKSGIMGDRVDVSTQSKETSTTSPGYTAEPNATAGARTSSGNYDKDSDTRFDDDDDNNDSGIVRFFKNLFGDDDNDDADKYAKVARRSEAVVTVHAQSKDEAQRAAEIMDDYNAIDVDKRASEYGYASSQQATGSDVLDNDTSKKIPIIEEDVQIGKREVETGGVRLRSRIIERPVEESLRLREERVRVERNTVDRKATGEDLNQFGERDIEMIEHAEVPVVNKEARVVEEISLEKDVDERTEEVRETARKTEVDVENLDKKETRKRKS